MGEVLMFVESKLGAIEKAFVSDMETNYLSVLKQFLENENKTIQVRMRTCAKQRTTIAFPRLSLFTVSQVEPTSGSV